MMCEYTVWYYETNVVLNDPLSLDSCTPVHTPHLIIHYDIVSVCQPHDSRDDVLRLVSQFNMTQLMPLSNLRCVGETGGSPTVLRLLSYIAQVVQMMHVQHTIYYMILM